jgi:hypothetical protein
LRGHNEEVSGAQVDPGFADRLSLLDNVKHHTHSICHSVGVCFHKLYIQTRCRSLSMTNTWNVRKNSKLQEFNQNRVIMSDFVLHLHLKSISPFSAAAYVVQYNVDVSALL